MAKKKYLIDNPDLMVEWDWEKNDELKIEPQILTIGSNKKVWWKCTKGHEWQTGIADRNRGYGCPYCTGQKVLKGYNDLATLNPLLAQEWNYEKNEDLKPEQFTVGSGKKVWWRCQKGHEWQSHINNRNKGIGCPYCSGRYAIVGETDLQTVNPLLAKEWSYEKNTMLTPSQVTFGSGKKVWWRCQKGHEWQATIVNRSKGRGCPICTSERHTSFPEYALLYYLKKYGLDALHSYQEKGYELDVYVPAKKTAIEYDGYFWHKNKEKNDIEKNRKCKKDGIQLYRIREELPPLNDSSIDYIAQNNRKSLTKIIEKILSEIVGFNVEIDLINDSIAIDNLREYTEKETSLLFSKPKIASEWHYEKNGKLKPENFLSNSGKKVWWKCNKGHEWQAKIQDRNRGLGCPYCSGRYAIKGETDLQTVNPKLASEWNHEKNNGLTPMDVLPNTAKKIWWKCQKEHEWRATVNSRTRGNGCPYCSGFYVIKGETDLQTINPVLANEWHYGKNNKLTPTDVLPRSNKKVWWKCNQGHEWQAIIGNRIKGHGCPYCAGQKSLKGKNDLQTVDLKLASEWNYEKNEDIKPEQFTVGSGKKVWWRCQKGHEWQAVISSRSKGHGCPYCSGRYAIKGETDLQTVNSKLASEWDYERNNGLTPADVLPSSNKKVWWQCRQGHKWQALINNRNKGRGCPYCSKRRRLN